MRVTHVVKVKGIAGAENHLLTLLPGLLARGADVRLLYLHEPHLPVDEFLHAAESRGIPTQRLPIRGSVDPLMTRRIARALGEHPPHIVHTHLLHADLYGIPAAHLVRVDGRRPAVVSSRHNDDAFRLSGRQRALNRTLWRLTDRGIAISEAVRDFSIRVEGARPDQIETIPYGLEAPPADPSAARAAARQGLGFAAHERIVGMTCRLVEQKGVAYALEAFARVVDGRPDARLVIIGDGPLRMSLETQASLLGLGSRARFLGWKADAARLMPAFDLFLMPSLWEGFGLVLLEAMAASLPIIASEVSAIPEVVVQDETGFLVPPRDVTKMSHELTRLLDDLPLARHMGMMGRERLETTFSPARMVERTLAVYERLLAR